MTTSDPYTDVPRHDGPEFTEARHGDPVRPDGTYTDPEPAGSQHPDARQTDRLDTDPMDDGSRVTDPHHNGASDDLARHEGTGTVGSAQQRDSSLAGESSLAGGSSTDAEGRERLVSTDRVDSYSSRWDTVKGTFVDEPRRAVAEADALVGELLQELETLFREQRRDIEHGLDADETSTEDLRLALRRYRSFFDRLLTI